MRVVLLLVVIAFLGCRREETHLREVSYGAEDMEARMHRLWFPVYYPIEELEDWLNRKFDRVIADTYLPFKGDSISLIVRKPGRIQLFLAGDSVDVVFPLQIEITEDREGKSGKKVRRRLTGALNLYLNIKPDVSRDWELLTTTNFQGYTWTERPRLETGGMKLGVKFIADYLLRNELRDLPALLDDALREKVDLKKGISRTWTNLQKPFPLYRADSTTTLWFKIEPDSLWGDIRISRKGLIFQLAVDARARVHRDSTRFLPVRPLPHFKPLAHIESDSNRLEVLAVVPLEIVNQVLKKVGNSYSGPLTVSDIKMRGSGKKLAFDLQTGGSSPAALRVIATPQYDTENLTLVITRPDYDLATEHKVLNAVDKRFREEILRYLDKKVILDMGEYTNDLPGFLNGTLNEGNEKFQLHFSEIQVENIRHATNESDLLIWFSCKPRFEITLKKLPVKKRLKIGEAG